MKMHLLIPYSICEDRPKPVARFEESPIAIQDLTFLHQSTVHSRTKPHPVVEYSNVVPKRRCCVSFPSWNLRKLAGGATIWLGSENSERWTAEFAELHRLEFQQHVGMLEDPILEIPMLSTEQFHRSSPEASFEDGPRSGPSVEGVPWKKNPSYNTVWWSKAERLTWVSWNRNLQPPIQTQSHHPRQHHLSAANHLDFCILLISDEAQRRSLTDEPSACLIPARRECAFR